MIDTTLIHFDESKDDILEIVVDGVVV